MKKGHLSDYFVGAAVKLLTQVEANPKKSNQHEFGTTPEMRNFLQTQKQTFPTNFIWLGDEQEGITDQGFTTMYDCREYKADRTPEWRIYYNSNDVTDLMEPDETLFIALRPDRSLLVVIVPTSSTICNQLLWLFGFDTQPTFKFDAQEFDANSSHELDFAARFILDELGIEYEDPDANSLDSIIDRFGTTFPKTKLFSDLARQTLPDIDAGDDPDFALMAWLDHEEALFRRLERRVVAERLGKGFSSDSGVDVDGFIKFSLSVQNRRKSRMGHSFENQLEAVLRSCKLTFDTQTVTESGNKPDFLFPGLKSYLDSSYPSDRLTMLGAKSSCKERWRQILPEAARISPKHLVTLEPGISIAQTDQMQLNDVQLVVPASLHSSYTKNQKNWLFNVADFVNYVRKKELC